jgi:nucleoid-associated protein YgaU
VTETPAPAAAPPGQLNPNVANTVTILPTAATPNNTPGLGRPAAAPTPDPFKAPRPVPPPEPKAQSYLEEQHSLQPGDSFQALSQRFYFDSKYAAALQEYNRNYPLASRELRQNPPALVPGQKVVIPPLRILERDHAQLIPGLQPLGPNGVPATPTSRPSGPVPVAPPSSANPGAKLTKVKDGGETLYEVASRTLSDNGQWYLIYRLNPLLNSDPKLPLPAGTVLRLPPEARVLDVDLPR